MPGGFATLEKVRIGESDQWILARSESAANPIILFLHGGPGTSQLSANKRDTRALERAFVVVDWDQRGAGKSYRAIDDVQRMNIAQFVQDVREMTLYLLKKFGKERLVLVGHSWGTVIGALAVARYPELFHCYVGISQVAHMAEGEALSYRWTLDQARKHEDRRAIAALERIGPPPYTGDWRAKTITERRYLARFGGEVHGSRIGALRRVLRGICFSREYSPIDRVNIFRGILGSMKLLWPELLTTNLFISVPEMRVPVLFAEGRFDYEVPSEIAARYFQVLKAPAKDWIWFEKSAHLPQAEEPEAFNRMILDRVLPLVA